MMIFRRLRELARCDSGIAYIEFAFAAPFLLALLMGGIEMTRYILITQKIEKVAMTVSDVSAQGQTITRADLNNIVTAAGEIMDPYNFTNNGYVIVSSVTQTGTYSAGNPPIVNWQYGGGGNWVRPSRIGSPGLPATLPGNLTLNDKDNIIVAEVFYNFQPLVATRNIIIGNRVAYQTIGSQTIYRTGLYKPRLGALTTLSALLPDLLMQKGTVL